MRITGGKYRGKKIESREDRGLRPTTAKIRESMFNILKHGSFLHDERFLREGIDDIITDQYVIDIFCGTGALGLESLSRGAKHAYFIDQSQATLNVARENAQSLGEGSHCSFIRADSTQLPPASQPCSLAFIDPPYGLNLGGKSFKTLAQNGWLSHGAIIILEQGIQDILPEHDNFELLNTRSKDKTALSIYQYVAEN